MWIKLTEFDGYYPTPEGMALSYGHLKIRLPEFGPRVPLPTVTVEIWRNGTWEEYHPIDAGAWRQGYVALPIKDARLHRVHVEGLVTESSMGMFQEQ